MTRRFNHRWLRAAMGAVVLAAVSACSSGGDSTGERLRPILEQTVFGGPIFGDAEPAPKPPVFTRAQLND